MQKYLSQLLADITYATENISLPFGEKELHLQDWIFDEDEDKTAPVRNLEEWTGISKEMLPPAGMLNDEQVYRVLDALKKMLDAYNWSFVLQTQVPERIQYTAIRDNFNQETKLKRWHMDSLSFVDRAQHTKNVHWANIASVHFIQNCFPALLTKT